MDRFLRDSLAAVEDRHWWFEGRRRILATTLDRIGASGPLLEVGCGNGANLEMLSHYGSVTGVEPDPADRERAAYRDAAVVLEGHLPDGLPPVGLFNTVLALDVIEHVEDDVASVQAMAGTLNPGGYLILTVPAHPWLWSAHDVINEHFRRYTRRALRKVIAQTELEIVQLTHFNTALLPLISLVRIGSRLADSVRQRDQNPEHSGGIGTGLPPLPVNSALMKLLSAESRLLGRLDLPAGVSILAVLRSP